MPYYTIIIILITIVLQFIVGHLLGFGLAVATGAGNGWELLVFPTGQTLGIWGIGAIMAWLRGSFEIRSYGRHLVGTIIGSALGVAVILITPPVGLIQIIYPLIGALLGFYISLFSK